MERVFQCEVLSSLVHDIMSHSIEVSDALPGINHRIRAIPKCSLGSEPLAGPHRAPGRVGLLYRRNPPSRRCTAFPGQADLWSDRAALMAGGPDFPVVVTPDFGAAIPSLPHCLVLSSRTGTGVAARLVYIVGLPLGWCYHRLLA